MPFAALGLDPKITKAVREAGYTEPTPIQLSAIPAVLAGTDVIGIAQTGTGKTAAFVLPILHRLSQSGSRSGKRSIRALIVAPTRELVVQIEENVRKYSRHLHLRTATVYGGVGEQPQIAALRQGTELVIATPGRLMDLMNQGFVHYNDLEVAVLDEADRMLDMGFLPAMRKIVRALPRERQTLMFSATLSKDIEQIAGEMLRNPQVLQVGKRSNPAETVSQHIYEVQQPAKGALLVHLLEDQSLESVLVFSRTKHGAEKIARRLTAAGVSTATIHSNRTQGQRIAALKAFRNGSVRVLVATDIAARGIDVEGITHVINFDFPPQPEDYVHRIGRTGRAKAIGDAISFITPDDRANLKALERMISRPIAKKVAHGFIYREAIETFRPESPRPRQTARPARVGARAATNHEAPRHRARPAQPPRSQPKAAFASQGQPPADRSRGRNRV